MPFEERDWRNLSLGQGFSQLMRGKTGQRKVLDFTLLQTDGAWDTRLPGTCLWTAQIALNCECYERVSWLLPWARTGPPGRSPTAVSWLLGSPPGPGIQGEAFSDTLA